MARQLVVAQPLLVHSAAGKGVGTSEVDPGKNGRVRGCAVKMRGVV